MSYSIMMIKRVCRISYSLIDNYKMVVLHNLALNASFTYAKISDRFCSAKVSAEFSSESVSRKRSSCCNDGVKPGLVWFIVMSDKGSLLTTVDFCGVDWCSFFYLMSAEFVWFWLQWLSIYIVVLNGTGIEQYKILNSEASLSLPFWFIVEYILVSYIFIWRVVKLKIISRNIIFEKVCMKRLVNGSFQSVPW